MNQLCCCPICGRMISFEEFHRNDIQSEYIGYCYVCEDLARILKQEEEICQKERTGYLR